MTAGKLQPVGSPNPHMESKTGKILNKIFGFLVGLILGFIAMVLFGVGEQILEKGCTSCPPALLPAGRKSLIFGLAFIYQGCMFLVAYRHEKRSWFFGILMSLARNVSMSGEHKPRELPSVTVERDGERVFPDENALGWALISLWGGTGCVVYAYLGANVWFFIILLLVAPVGLWQLIMRLRRPKDKLELINQDNRR